MKTRNALVTWYVLSNEVGTILAVYGSALESEAVARGKDIANQTACKVALHFIGGKRPGVGGSISMRGDIRWL